MHTTLMNMMLLMMCMESLVHAVEVLRIPRNTIPYRGYTKSIARLLVCDTAESLEALLVPFPESPGLSCASQSYHPVRSLAVVHQTLKLGALHKLIVKLLSCPEEGGRGADS